MFQAVPARFAVGRAFRHFAIATAASLALLSPVAAFGVAPIAN